MSKISYHSAPILSKIICSYLGISKERPFAANLGRKAAIARVLMYTALFALIFRLTLVRISGWVVTIIYLKIY